MKLYFAKRGKDDWEGGLIIAAESGDDAKKWFSDWLSHEIGEFEYPTYVKELDITKPGIVYVDELR